MECGQTNLTKQLLVWIPDPDKQWKKGLVFWVTLHVTCCHSVGLSHGVGPVTWGHGLSHGVGPVTWGGACHMGHGLSHGVGPVTWGMACHMGWGLYGAWPVTWGGGLLPIKNFMITFYIQDSSLDC